jgi:hypothetical protein
MPSSPARSIAAKARYGLQDESGIRSSIRVSEPRGAGMRMRGLRLRSDQAMWVGASNPGMSRLYELTSGLVMAQNDSACWSSPPMKLVQVRLNPNGKSGS